MTRRMLINAIYPEECRVAVAEDDKLIELEVERNDLSLLKGNIYKAPITRIEPSLQAAFLDIGSSRNGFLQINDINPSYFGPFNPPEDEPRARPSIQDVLNAQQDLVVQVVKDERSAKGATLTTNLSIPGRYLVLMVGNQRGGVSRKIVDEGQRRRLRQAIQGLKIPAGMGVIVRTAGINKSAQELQRDLDALMECWFEIVEKCHQPGGPILLYRESALAIRTIRDFVNSDIDEILVDCEDVYNEAKAFVRRIIPNFEPKVKLFDKPQPLFSSFHLDNQVDETTQAEVTLPSGGSIVINVTEAVVAIDVNSGRSTSQADVEETAFATNQEAAQVIATQLRLRDLGGLIVIDFIDMSDRKRKQIVEKTLKDSVRGDKAKVEVGRISKFGLLEMSRQRLKSSLASQSQVVCPHCQGRGRVKTSESASLEALRKIQSAAFAGGVEEIRVHLAPAPALLLLNQKRKILTEFEDKSNTRIMIFADGRLKPEEYKLELVTEKSSENQVIESRSGSHDQGRSEEGGRRRGGRDSSRRRSRGKQSRSGGGRGNRRSSGSSGNRDRNRRSRKNQNGRGNEGAKDSAPAEKSQGSAESSAPAE